MIGCVRPESRTGEWRTRENFPGKCLSACVRLLTALRVIRVSHSEKKSRTPVRSDIGKGGKGKTDMDSEQRICFMLRDIWLLKVTDCGSVGFGMMS